MPRIDPQQLLKTLGILLSPDGGIKSSDEVDRLVKLMSKFSRKLVSKCIYVQILQATDRDLLGHFLANGGWTLLNSWFDDAIKTEPPNWPLVKEMCVLFMKCPMTAQLLKENMEEHQAPKLINQIRNENLIGLDIRGLASELYRSWVEIVQKENSPPAGNVIVINTGTGSSAGGPVSLLQSLADEVSENLKKETTTSVSSNITEEETSSSFKIRKVPTVIKPRSTIIDATISKSSSSNKNSKISSKHNEENISSKDSKKDKSNKDKEKIKKRPEISREKSDSSSSGTGNSSKERSSSSSSKRFRQDGFRDEVNPEEKQRIKDLARKMKEEAQSKKDKVLKNPMPSLLPKLPKIPKKSNSDKEKSGGALSFEDMLGGLDSKSKPKTVKTPMIKNKTAALLEGMKSPTSKTSSSTIKSSSHSSSSLSKKDHSSSSSSSRSKDHHRDHHHSSSKLSSSSSSSSSSKNDKKLSLKIPSPATTTDHTKRKPSGDNSESPKSSVKSTSVSGGAKSPSSSSTNYAESSTFMDALFSSVGIPIRKKKRRLSEPEGKDSDSTKTTTLSSPTQPKVAKTESPKNTAQEPETETVATPAFSFYKDTQDEQPKEEVVKDEPAEMDTENSKPDPDVAEPTEENQKSSPKEIDSDKENSSEEKIPFNEPDEMPREVKGILVYHRGRGKRDKRITWRAETNLVQVQYFEVDENERVNVNKLKFENLREFESKMEKAALSAKGDITDTGEDANLLPWYKPLPIKVTNREPFTPGETSKEKEIQNNREKNVLSTIYFSKEATPSTPHEADPETGSSSMKSNQPAFIPLEDSEADENSEFNHQNKGWTAPKENKVSQQAQIESQLSQFSLPPALSSLLSSIKNEGFDQFKSIIPSVNTISNLTKEEQDTLAAQTMALKMGILPSTMPGGPGSGGPMPNSNFPPNSMGMNGPPPSAQNQMNGPPPDFNRFPPPGSGPPGNNGFPIPPPFGGPSQNNGPPSNGFYNQPPPFGGPPRNGGRGGFDGGNNRGGYDGGNNRGGYNGGNNRGGYDQGGYRNGGGPQRGGGFHNNRDFRRDDRRNNDHRIGTRPCKFFVQKGFCREGDSCRFRHEQPTGRES